MPTKILGAITGSNKAIKAQNAAANAALDVQERMYNQSREDLLPYRNQGYQANDTLSYLLGLNPTKRKDENGVEYDPYDTINKDIGAAGTLSHRFGIGDFQEDPGYQYSLQEGNKAIDAAQAKRGGFFSGNALKEATKYNQNMANQQYDTVRNRFLQDQDSLYNKLAGVSNSGQQATNTGVQTNTQNADATGNIYGNLGNAKAGAYLANGDFLSKILGAAASSYAKSDINYKENIIHVGQENGHNLYLYNYKGEDKKYIGVMAQEVEKTHPQAVIDTPTGKMVNYSMIGVNLRELN